MTNTNEPLWLPRPDPALVTPLPPGIRPHRHEPDHLHGWVFLQELVWVDYWGNEHEIEAMPIDYVEAVIRFCDQRVEPIRMIVAAELGYRIVADLAGVGAPPTAADVAILEAIARDRFVTSGVPWLRSLPLLIALTSRRDHRDRAERIGEVAGTR